MYKEVKLMPVYTVNVLTGAEKDTARNIKRINHPDIKKVYNPLSIFDEPVFPGYIFIEMPFKAEPYYAIMNIPGVLCFVSPAFGVFPLSTTEKNHLKALDMSFVSPVKKHVLIVKGSYAGLSGIIEKFVFPTVHIRSEGLLLKTGIRSIIEINAYKFPFPSVGSRVKIIKGSFKGISGYVEKIYPEDKRILIKTNSFTFKVNPNHIVREESLCFQE